MAEKKNEDEGGSKLFTPLGETTEELQQIESLCMRCMKQGITKMMLTMIPFYKEVIISSFACEHCHYKNSELSSAMTLAPLGILYELKVTDPQDLSRIVVKTDYAAVTVPELDLEIPMSSQKGEITTVQGILWRVVEGLEQDQERRKLEHEDTYEKIKDYLVTVKECMDGKTNFSLIIRDISGNSFIGNRSDALQEGDNNLTIRKFTRNTEESKALGMEMESVEEENEEEEGNIKDEVLEMGTDCSNCGAPCTTKMKVTEIPFFKEVIIMATDCDRCGHRTNEVKSGGGIEPKGKRIELKVKSKDDLSRDLLKPETCKIEIPELEMEAGSGAIVGKFTTVEGILMDVKKQFSEENPLFGGDSSDPTIKGKMIEFQAKLDRCLTGEYEFTLILDDPAGNCYMQNIFAPDDDPEMTTVQYERSFDQNEELGLNDMNV